MNSRSEWIYSNQENVLPSLTHNIQKQKTTRWFQPNLKNLQSNWIIFPGKGKNAKKNMFKPPARLSFFWFDLSCFFFPGEAETSNKKQLEKTTNTP